MRDCRRLNDVTIKDKYSLPRIDDALASLSVNKYFTSLDYHNETYKFPWIRKTNKKKTAFTTDSGLYHFNFMNFGLTNAPATFQRYMDAVFAGLKRNCLLVYVDDILIFSPTFEAKKMLKLSTDSRTHSLNLPNAISLKRTCLFGPLTYLQLMDFDPIHSKAILEMETPTQ